jgi:hypothetical protein
MFLVEVFFFDGMNALLMLSIFMGNFIHDGFMSARDLGCAGEEAGV